MGGINRFMAPVKDQYQQTYVDQYVPLPFEIMQKRAEGEQKKFDTAQNNWDVLQTKMGEQLLDEDNHIMASSMDNIRNGVEGALKEAGGDFRKVNRLITNSAGEYNKSVKSGEIALAKTQKAKYEENLKTLDASGMSGSDVADAKTFMRDDYKQGGGVAGGAEFGNTKTYNIKGIQKEMNTMIQHMKGDSESKPYAGINEDGSLIVHSTNNTEKLTRADIGELSTMVKGNPDFQAFVDVKWDLDRRRGIVPDHIETKEEFAQYKFEEMIDPMKANAYTKELKTKKIQQTAIAKAKATTKKAKFKPQKLKVDSNIDVAYFAEDELLDPKTNKPIAKNMANVLILKNLESGKDLVSKTLKDAFWDANGKDYETHGKSNTAFDAKLKGWMVDQGYSEEGSDLTNDDMNELLQFAATSDDLSSLKPFFNSQSKYGVDQFQKMAKASWSKIQHRNLLLKEVNEEMVAEGRVNGTFTDLTAAATANQHAGNMLGIQVTNWIGDDATPDIEAYTKNGNTYYKQEGRKEGYGSDVAKIVLSGDPSFFTAGGANSKAKKLMEGMDRYNDAIENNIGKGDKGWEPGWEKPGFAEMAEAYQTQVLAKDTYEKVIDEDYILDLQEEKLRARMQKGSIEIPTTNMLDITYIDDGSGNKISQGGTLNSEDLYEQILKDDPSIDNLSIKTTDGDATTVSDYLDKAVTVAVANAGKKKLDPITTRAKLREELMRSAKFTQGNNPVSGQQELILTGQDGKVLRVPVDLGGKGSNNVLGIGKGQFTVTQKAKTMAAVSDIVRKAQIGHLTNAPIGDTDLGFSIHTSKPGSEGEVKGFNSDLTLGGKHIVQIDAEKLGIFVKGNESNNLISFSGETSVKALHMYTKIMNGTVSAQTAESLGGGTKEEMVRTMLRRMVGSEMGTEKMGTEKPAEEVVTPPDLESYAIKRKAISDKAKAAKTKKTNAYVAKKKAEALAAKKKEVADPNKPAAPVPEEMTVDSIAEVKPTETKVKETYEDLHQADADSSVEKQKAPASMDDIPSAEEIKSRKDSKAKIPVADKTGGWKQVVYDDEKMKSVGIKDYYGNDIELKKPVADALIAANNSLTNDGIEIKIADNYVSKDVKIAAKKVYDKQLAEFTKNGYYTKGGKKVKSKPPKQAGSKSFHSHGQAIDLQQIHSMKDNAKVYAALKEAGFRQHPDEWWHWSIGEFTHKDHDHG